MSAAAIDQQLRKLRRTLRQHGRRGGPRYSQMRAEIAALAQQRETTLPAQPPIEGD